MTPEQASSLMRRAIRLQEQGRSSEAVGLYDGIIEHYPNHPDALHNCGLARLAAGEFGAAERLLLRAIQLRPNFDRARANLVKLWTRMDRAQTLAEITADGVWIAALDLDACMALSEFFLRRREYERCIAPLERAVALDPCGVRARHLLGTALYRLNAAEEGERHLREALRLKPEDASIMIDLARCLFSVHLRSRRNEAWSEGRALIVRALAREPQNARIRHEMGMVLEEEGELDAAKATYAETLARAPEFLPALTSLAAISRASVSPDVLLQLENALSKPGDFPAPEISRAWQALGKCHDALGEPDRAFDCFENANRMAADGRTYDRKRRESYVANLIATYSGEAIARHWPARGKEGKPVFIVGMPRSGTTLLEHMLAGHPQIEGAGELPFFTSLERTRGALHQEDGRPSERWGERIGSEYRQALRAQFDAILAGVDARARYVIDKMPFNFAQLGMVTFVHPEAKILHCIRDGRDVGLSCFIESFHETHAWSLSLPDIGNYERQYERLMAHWAAVFGERIHPVSYEALIADPDAVLDGVLDFLGLERSGEMASYRGQERLIRTPSNWQVRQPIYGTSVGRWKRYESHLDPLFRELRD
jgi:tetratricopeptide (TPR) repeat protein